MKKPYSLMLALGVVAASLSSCSRTDYAFNPKTPAYLGTTRVVAPVPAATPLAKVTAPTEAAAVAPVAAAPAPMEATPVAKAPVASGVPAPPQAVAAQTVAAAPVAKPTFMQRLALKKVLKQATRMQAREQNTASVAHPAIRLGPGLYIAIVGLVLTLIGALVSVNFITIVGAIVLLVGIAVFILNLLQ